MEDLRQGFRTLRVNNGERERERVFLLIGEKYFPGREWCVESLLSRGIYSGYGPYEGLERTSRSAQSDLERARGRKSVQSKKRCATLSIKRSALGIHAVRCLSGAAARAYLSPSGCALVRLLVVACMRLGMRLCIVKVRARALARAHSYVLVRAPVLFSWVSMDLGFLGRFERALAS